MKTWGKRDTGWYLKVMNSGVSPSNSQPSPQMLLPERLRWAGYHDNVTCWSLITFQEESTHRAHKHCESPRGQACMIFCVSSKGDALLDKRRIICIVPTATIHIIFYCSWTNGEDRVYGSQAHHLHSPYGFLFLTAASICSWRITSMSSFLQ